MIIDPRMRRDQRAPLYINGIQVGRVKTFKFLGTHISEDLSCTHNTQQIIKKAQQWLFFLRKLIKFGLTSKLRSNFYRCTVESILKNSIIVWNGNSTAQDRKALQHVIKTTQFICGVPFPPLQGIYNARARKRAHNIIKDCTHPQHTLFTQQGQTEKKNYFHLLVSIHKPSDYWITDYCDYLSQWPQ